MKLDTRQKKMIRNNPSKFTNAKSKEVKDFAMKQTYQHNVLPEALIPF